VRRATLHNPSMAVDDEVPLQTGWVNTRALERERNTEAPPPIARPSRNSADKRLIPPVHGSELVVPVKGAN